MENKRRRKKKKSGCLTGVIVAIAAIARFCVLLFTTNWFNGLKFKVLSLFYPQTYSEEVQASAKEFSVDENLIYAVIYTESGFRADAESGAGAVGLMQLMPETFTWLQERLDGEVVYSEDALKTPSVNIRYGTYFLSYLLEQYSDVPTALAAYNAGTTNVDRWLSDSAYSSDGKTLDDIPYDETRNYVKKVTDVRKKYENIYGG